MPHILVEAKIPVGTCAPSPPIYQPNLTWRPTSEGIE